MALIRLDENFTAPRIYNRISEVQDNLLFYAMSALPIVPEAFDIIVITECLHATKNSSVYCGHFEDRVGKRYEEYDVAFKFGDEEQLCREAEQYDTMFKLQGNAIPRLIGLAFAKRTGEGGGGYFACLMTEKFGSSLDCDLISLARPDKAIILNHLQAIHNKGLIHPDFKESNVLQRGAEFRLVDFNRMLETHKCSVTAKAINFSQQPESFTMEDWKAVCPHIRVHALDMDFWDDGTVFINGYSWKKDGLPSARIMELLFPKALKSKYVRTQELPEILQLYFKHVQTLLESGQHDVEYLKAHINETAAQIEKKWWRSIKQSSGSPTRARAAAYSQSDRLPSDPSC